MDESSLAHDLLRRAKSSDPGKPRAFVGRRIAKVSADVRLTESSDAALLVTVERNGRVNLGVAATAAGWQAGPLDVVLVGDGICVLGQIQPDEIPRSDPRPRSMAALRLDQRNRVLLSRGVRRYLGAEPGSTLLVSSNVRQGQILLAHMPTVAAAVHDYAARLATEERQEGMSHNDGLISW